MEFIQLLTLLLSVTFLSKIISTYTKTVDILWYIILGLVATQYVFHIDSIQLENWSTMGVVFIMFYAGWKENLIDFIAEIWKNKWISLIAAIGPFVGAWLAFSILGFKANEAIVAGFIFTATAVPYTIAVLRNLGLEQTPAAKAVLSSAMADNFLSIFMAVGVLPAIAIFHGSTNAIEFSEILSTVGHQFGLVAGAFVLFAFLGLVIFPDSNMKMMFGIPNMLQRDGIQARISYFIYRLRSGPGLRSLGSAFLGVNIGIPMTLLLIFGLAWLAHTMGLHPAIGAYLTGLILDPRMFKTSTLEANRHDQVAVDHESLTTFFYFLQEWVGPIFFIYLGSLLVADWSQVGLVLILGLVAALIIGFFQFGTAYFAGKNTSKLHVHDAILLGFSMLPRDVLAFVVLGIATTTGLIIDDSLFVIVTVFTILLLNIATSLSIYWYKPRYIKSQETLENKQKQGA